MYLHIFVLLSIPPSQTVCRQHKIGLVDNAVSIILVRPTGQGHSLVIMIGEYFAHKHTDKLLVAMKDANISIIVKVLHVSRIFLPEETITDTCLLGTE